MRCIRGNPDPEFHGELCYCEDCSPERCEECLEMFYQFDLRHRNYNGWGMFCTECVRKFEDERHRAQWG